MTLDRERIETGARLAREAEKERPGSQWWVSDDPHVPRFAVEPEIGLIREKSLAAFIAHCNPAFVLEIVREVERRAKAVDAVRQYVTEYGERGLPISPTMVLGLIEASMGVPRVARAALANPAAENDPLRAPQGFGADADPPYGDDSGPDDPEEGERG